LLDQYVALAEEIQAQFEETKAALTYAVKTCRDWEAMYDERTAALKEAEGERDLALWVIRVPGMETGGPPTCIGTYDPNGHETSLCARMPARSSGRTKETAPGETARSCLSFSMGLGSRLAGIELALFADSSAASWTANRQGRLRVYCHNSMVHDAEQKIWSLRRNIVGASVLGESLPQMLLRIGNPS
jgi:hypothetical protein